MTDQKKVIIATYTVEECFKIPVGIDLDNKAQVKEWWIKYNRLYIDLTNNNRLVINSQYWINNYDYKYPNDENIYTAEEYGVDEEDEDWQFFDCQTGEVTPK